MNAYEAPVLIGIDDYRVYRYLHEVHISLVSFKKDLVFISVRLRLE